MSKVKKILLAIMVVFIAMNFVRPSRNISNDIQPSDMITALGIPANVAGSLKASCYDCHSNNTRYPWYVNIQPIGWLLASHVNEGKEELNFSAFTSYSKRRQLSKLKAIQNSIKDGSMPLTSYTMLHTDAKLSVEERTSLTQWTAKVIDSLSGQ